MSIYVIDIDKTICVPNHDADDTWVRYGEAEPIWDVIETIQTLYGEGHTIILHTARRMLTHNGDVAKIIADVGQITVDWLRDAGVPYHQLVFGKPYGDFYIDDKAMLPDEFVRRNHHCDAVL
jgi:capsule biosynthesis phosphatase